MVIHEPEPQRPEPRKLGTKGVLGVVAALIIGAVVFGQLTTMTPEPLDDRRIETNAPHTPPSTLPLVEQGIPFDWHVVTEMDSHEVVAMVEWNDEVLLFASRWDGFEVGGLDLFVVDPTEARPSGTVIASEYRVHRVSATPMGLIAVGHHPASGASRVWISENGRVWVAVNFPEPQHNFISFAHHAGDNLVLIAHPRHQPGPPVELLVEELTGVGGWVNQGGPRGSMALLGPLGIPYRTVTLDELGIHLADYPVEPSMTGATVMVRERSGAWTSTRLDPEFFVMSLYTGPDGDVWMGAFSPFVATRASSDGITWREGGPPEDFSVSPFGTGWIRGPLVGLPGSPTSFSADGLRWNPLRFPEFLTTPSSSDGRVWGTPALTVVENGLATVAVRWQMSVDPGPAIPVNDPLTLERDGYVLAVSTGLVQLLKDDQVQVTINRTAGRVSDRVRVDTDARTVTFVDSNGAVQASFTFDELESLEADERNVTEAQSPVVEQAVFLYTADGRDWTIQDITGLSGPLLRALGGPNPSRVEMFGDRVYLIFDNRFDGPNPGGAISIWTASIPESHR